jgi:hypothetical protein
MESYISGISTRGRGRWPVKAVKLTARQVKMSEKPRDGKVE